MKVAIATASVLGAGLYAAYCAGQASAVVVAVSATPVGVDDRPLPSTPKARRRLSQPLAVPTLGTAAPSPRSIATTRSTVAPAPHQHACDTASALAFARLASSEDCITPQDFVVALLDDLQLNLSKEVCSPSPFPSAVSTNLRTTVPRRWLAD